MKRVGCLDRRAAMDDCRKDRKVEKLETCVIAVPYCQGHSGGWFG